MVRDPRDAIPTDSEPSDDDADDGELLELLSDEYTQRLLEALSDSPQPARALVEATDMSRPTVYRRLNRLAECGLVRSQTAVHPDGHHRDVFEAVLDQLTVDIDADGPTVRVTVDQQAPTDTPRGVSAD